MNTNSNSLPGPCSSASSVTGAPARSGPLELSVRLSPAIAILGVPFDPVTTPEAIARIEAMIASRRPHYLATANVDFLVQAREDVELRRILFEADLILCDGTPLVWASGLLGNRLPERVAGSDLVPLLMRVAEEKQYRLFFLGSTPAAVERAVTRLRAEHPRLLVAGHYSPPFSRLLDMDHEEIRQRIMAAQPDLLFVAFGCPKQEKWIAMHYRTLGVPVAVGVGATIDFLAGEFRRAPVWMQRSGTEWIFRLLQEPRRLARRYGKDLWVFGCGLVAQWWHLQRFCLRRLSRASGTAEDADLVTGAELPLQPEASRKAGAVILPALPPKRCAAAGQSAGAVQYHRAPGCLAVPALQANALHPESILATDRDCVLDVSQVEFIDSTGLGLLIRLQKCLRAAGRQLVLLAPSPVVQQALGLARLEGFFVSVPDLPTATHWLAVHRREQAEAVLVRLQPTAAVLTWRGEITATNVSQVWEGIRTRFSELAAVPRWLMDFSAVAFIDSAGLDLLLRTAKMARKLGIALNISGLQPAVRNVIHLACLETFFLNDTAPAPSVPAHPQA